MHIFLLSRFWGDLSVHLSGHLSSDRTWGLLVFVMLPVHRPFFFPLLSTARTLFVGAFDSASASTNSE